jgi:hypothetical protein
MITFLHLGHRYIDTDNNFKILILIIIKIDADNNLMENAK